MIEHKIGDLFSNTEGYIVHGCNAQGVMGSGVAKIIKDQYFDAFKRYAECYVHKTNKGEPMLGSISWQKFNDGKLMIVNAVTQEFYGREGKLYTSYDAVRSCFAELMDDIHQYKEGHFPDIPDVINFPLIGCGLGGGDWDIVAAIIDEEIDDSFKKVLWTLK